MKFGVCLKAGSVAKAGAVGFEFAELRACEVASLSDADFTALASKMASSPIKPECYNVIFTGASYRLVSPGIDKDKLSEYLHKTFARLQTLGGKIVVLGSGGARKVPEGGDKASAFAELVESVKFMGDIASKFGLTIAIEPLRRGDTNLINTVSEGAELVTTVGHPSVGLLADIFHMTANGEQAEDIVKAGKLVHVHVCGEGRKFPKLKDLAYLAPFVKALMDIGYDGRISVEAQAPLFLGSTLKGALATLKEAFR